MFHRRHGCKLLLLVVGSRLCLYRAQQGEIAAPPAYLARSYDIMDGAKLSTKTSSSPLRGLQELGQSVWLDYIRRDLIASGELQRLVDERGVTGVTANPSVFEKAIWSSQDLVETLPARFVGRFELLRTEPPEVAVTSCSIVEGIDVVEPPR